MSRATVFSRPAAFATAAVLGVALAGAGLCLSPNVCTAQASQAKVSCKCKASSGTVKQLAVSKKGSVKGNVSYTLYCGTKKVTAKNGKAAKASGKANAVSVKLSGKLKKSYSVKYRVMVNGYGWLDWTANGKKAGTGVKGKTISKVEVKLVSSFKQVAKRSNVTYVTNPNFLKLTGNVATDATIMDAAEEAKQGGSADESLLNCFKWVVKNITYNSTERPALDAGTIPAARLKSEGKAAFGEHKGDCYTFTSATYYLGTYLGFDMKPVCGYQKKNGSWAAFSWAEKVQDSGENLIYDAVGQQTYDPDFTGFVKISGADYAYKACGITMSYINNHPSDTKTPSLSYTNTAA